MNAQRLRMAHRMLAVAGFRETLARQALVAANHALATADEAVREAEHGLVWLETRRCDELAGGSPDPAIIASLDAARDLAGEAWAVRSTLRDERRGDVERDTAGWAHARQRESVFEEHHARVLAAHKGEQARTEADAMVETWLVSHGGGR